MHKDVYLKAAAQSADAILVGSTASAKELQRAHGLNAGCAAVPPYTMCAGLRDKTKPLARHPELGRTGRPGLPDWLRELVVHPSYIAFYRVVAAERTVQILRLKHTAQQLP